MAGTLYEFDPVTHVTTGYIGQPGKRVFYLQAFKGREVITLIVEKQQVEALAYYVEEFLTELKEKHPALPEASPDYDPHQMALNSRWIRPSGSGNWAWVMMPTATCS